MTKPATKPADLVGPFLAAELDKLRRLRAEAVEAVEAAREFAARAKTTRFQDLANKRVSDVSRETVSRAVENVDVTIAQAELAARRLAAVEKLAADGLEAEALPLRALVAELASEVEALDAMLIKGSGISKRIGEINDTLYRSTAGADVGRPAYVATNSALSRLMMHRTGTPPENTGMLGVYNLPDRGADPAGHIAVLGGYHLGWQPGMIAKAVATMAIQRALADATDSFVPAVQA